MKLLVPALNGCTNAACCVQLTLIHHTHTHTHTHTHRIIQHKIFFIVGAIVILLVIALLIFAIVMIKKNQG